MQHIYKKVASILATVALFLSMYGTAFAVPYQPFVGGTGNAGTLSGLVKANGTSPFTSAVAGTDFSLVTALTCGAGNHFSAVTALGIFTCSADSGGGAVWPFTIDSYNGALAQSTTTQFWLKNTTLIASSTIVSNYLRVGTSTDGIFAATFGSSTAAQIALTDNNPADNIWIFRAINNNFYLATSTAIATSSTAALFINGTNSAFTFNSGATSTFTSGLQATFLNITGTTATSTFGNGMTINTGCYAIGQSCISLSNLSGNVPVAQGGTGATSLSAGFIVNSNALSIIGDKGFDYWATSTTLFFQAGTSTQHYIVITPFTMIALACQVRSSTGGAFMNVQVGNGTASSTMIQASSTRNINNLATPVSFTAGQRMDWDFGTTTVPVNITDVPCTWQQRT